ncbi:MAG TPA: UdgX family uracil-DNA binding protein [Vicinamibacterales bacterium]|nr:UdgX family uracil-DNA binding protein [Vicinamibacterales bacterium]
MERVTVNVDAFDDWRDRARVLLSREVPPDAVDWADAHTTQPALPDFAIETDPVINAASSRPVPRQFLDRARTASYHRDPRKWAILYRLAYRLTRENRDLLSDDLDPDVIALQTMSRQVARDIHKMHAFVRFREVEDADGPHYIAWHRPDHLIVRPAASFFRERFRIMRWTILTPDESVHWDGAELTFGPGVPQSQAPQADRLEDLWRTYYKAMFNPARLNPRAMTRELPVRHWPTLPEAQLIKPLMLDAPNRVASMIAQPSTELSARPFVPENGSIDQLRASAPACRGCPLVNTATQVVFGEGSSVASTMLIGEQPGDAEDQLGRPFVGPAGEVLDRALAEAGIERPKVYLTNAVKHFSFHREGKRRIHEKPRAKDVRACRPWLEAEIDRIKPDVIVCLGSTAAQALLGPSIRIQRDRGQEFRAAWAPRVIVTYHPSAVLRADDPKHSEEIYAWLVEDLRLANQPQGK